MGRIDTVMEVAYLGEKAPTKNPQPVLVSINTFSWLQIKNTGQSSPQILARIHTALKKENPSLPTSIQWSDIAVNLPTSKPASD